ncbi:MAG: DHA2 family efflux MFS transporter permease subunit [Micrococcales bacterium]|nr:DHA2 family efflux MFS transporter permease subunit [Micrococcales bacterium]
MPADVKPWPALWAIVVGFFMILVDTTIVAVANPTILQDLKTDVTSVLWVTSAYLLAYAVPLLITGRLGDRFGPKNLYLAGLAVFTLASLWCGVSGTIGMLILARVVQGLGAALMTPQTMAIITRIFPPDRRGAAMGLWGSTAGVATLVGPVLGGLLVPLGWEWIFLVNLPVGIVGFVLALRLVPKLPTSSHSFDILGVVLSAAGMFLVVFGIQELNSDGIPGAALWTMIAVGVAVLVAFVVWQRINRREPLLPLGLFRDRNFALGTAAITVVGFFIVCMTLPLIFYFQLVRGLTPLQSAFMLVPMAVVSTPIAPFVGRALDTRNPRTFAVIGTGLFAVALFLYAALLSPDIWLGWLLVPAVIMGVASGFMWAPISNTATRNLPPQKAGAGAGVFNAVRQVGSVLGSASIAALISSRLTAELPTAPGGAGSGASEFSTGQLPGFLQAPFTTAMAQSMLLPAFVSLLAVAVVVFFAKPVRREGWANPTGAGRVIDAVAPSTTPR